MTLSLVLSAALALLTGVAALLWAGFVAPERRISSMPRPPRPAHVVSAGRG
ncbi:hypothetical protein ACU4GR_13350 [Methylobacterium oryzae CBMB20]